MINWGKNLKLKLISLFFAIILWIYIVNVQNPEIEREIPNIPVEIINIDSIAEHNLVLANEGNYFTEVEVKGKRNIIMKLSKNDVKATADLSGFNKIGTITIPVKVDVLGGQEVKILEHKPDNIQIDVEEFTQVHKMVEVIVKNQKNINTEYAIKSIRPNVVIIKGPHKLVESINSVKVFVDVDNQKKDISVVEEYNIFDKDGVDITDRTELIKDNQSIQVDIEYTKILD